MKVINMWFLVFIVLNNNSPVVAGFRPQPDLHTCLSRQIIMTENVAKKFDKSLFKVRCLKLSSIKNKHI